MALQTLPLLSCIVVFVPRYINGYQLLAEIHQNVYGATLLWTLISTRGRGGGVAILHFSMSRKPVLAFNFGLTAHDLTFTFERE